MGTDSDGPTDLTQNTHIYVIDKTTGAGTRQRTYLNDDDFTSLTIDPLGRFFISSIGDTHVSPGMIHQLDPATGTMSFVTTTGLTGSDHFRDIRYSPADGKWYGLEERRTASPRAWYLHEITGMPVVPEPGSIFVIAMAGAVALPRRSRRR
jgi:hypothetical protein